MPGPSKQRSRAQASAGKPLALPGYLLLIPMVAGSTTFVLDLADRADTAGGPMRSTRTARRLLVLLVRAGIPPVPATAGAATFPDTIRLPDGWQPEGIAAGRGTSLYVRSLPHGALWEGAAPDAAG